jgi:hypothetical protein
VLVATGQERLDKDEDADSTYRDAEGLHRETAFTPERKVPARKILALL